MNIIFIQISYFEIFFKMESKLIRVCFELWNLNSLAKQKYVWLNPKDSLEVIDKEAMKKFQINENPNFFTYLTKKHLCAIDSSEDLIFDDTVIMVKKTELDKLRRHFESPKALTREDSLKFEPKEEQKLSDQESVTDQNDQEFSMEADKLNDSVWANSVDYSSEEGEDYEDNVSEGEDKTESEKEMDEINLGELKEIKQDNSSELDRVIKEWAAKKKFTLVKTTGEKFLKKEGCYCRVYQCNQFPSKGCPFFLEFKKYTDLADLEKKEESGAFYKLTGYFASHNHDLNKFDGKDRITDQILASIKRLKGKCLNNGQLTKFINEEFKTNFKTNTISNQVKLLETEEHGPPSEDANRLIEALRKEAKYQNCFYKEKVEKSQFKSLFFMSKRMKSLVQNFGDVIFMDATHKSNRFNLPLFDGVIINNYGKSCTCFWSLLENEKEDSFYWALSQFKEISKMTPALIFSDEDDALRNGIFIFYDFNLFCSYTSSLS